MKNKPAPAGAAGPLREVLKGQIAQPQVSGFPS